MAAKKWIGLLFGAAAVYWIYNKFKFSQSLSFIPTRIKVGGSILNPEITLGVKLFNPSNVSTKFSNLDAELFLDNGQKVADVYFNQSINIPAKSETELNLMANTSFSNLVSSLTDIFTSKQLNFVVKGVADVDSIRLPFTINYKFFA